MSNLVITRTEFEEAREKSDEMWTDYEVFEEERDPVDLHRLVKQVVEGQYTHPDGAESLYGLESSAQGLVSDLVHSSSNDIVPTTLPTEVLDKFCQKLSSDVQEYSEDVYKEMKSDLDPEKDHELSEVQRVLDKIVENNVPETF